MLLQNRITIVHGGSGAVGSAVARAYAREGAEVHLTGRTRATLEDVAHSIRDEGGIAHVAVLDAVDRDATRLLLPRRPSYADVANAAVFAASDWATAMTATEINLTGGAVVD
ncbi:SDR family NAD(P)-dependent oxidoreductase [Rhodococcus sp. 21391]|uniref:SDR family NAD(P)-dependent oxidoreductase n=1 Tax=Rhodococcus sp. 21391 TaxID=2683591 RepID=UPI00192AEBE2|nr:SDR family NAD(P)-dependent oxidoreductase [Rhodococcus sp. 21391]QQZ16766.1 SDR family NAD(P)-dependent oxidoreductase [Rhodococcus sp. 21391]